MNSIKELENQINKINQRNNKVENDKAWETSCIRKVLVLILTYIVIVIFFYIAELPNPMVNAIVPALAFVISTLTLSFFKKIWLKKNDN